MQCSNGMLVDGIEMTMLHVTVTLCCVHLGKDATGGFYGRNHSVWAQKRLKELEIGSLGDCNKKWFVSLSVCAWEAGISCLSQGGRSRSAVIKTVYLHMVVTHFSVLNGLRYFYN